MQRGFTAVELAMVLTIATILVPLVYTFGAKLEDQATHAEWQLDVADSARTVAEELALDARLGAPTPEVGFDRGACQVRYAVAGAALVRQASADCGGTRGLAATVEAIAWTPGGVDVTFARVLRADRVARTTLFIPVDGR